MGTFRKSPVLIMNGGVSYAVEPDSWGTAPLLGLDSKVSKHKDSSGYLPLPWTPTCQDSRGASLSTLPSCKHSHEMGLDKWSLEGGVSLLRHNMGPNSFSVWLPSMTAQRWVGTHTRRGVGERKEECLSRKHDPPCSCGSHGVTCALFRPDSWRTE